MNIKNRVRNRLILPALCSLATMANSQTWTSLTELSLTDPNHTTQLNKTDENPVRGFTPGFDVSDPNFPHSIVRKYLRFDDIFDSSNDTLKKSYLDAEIKKVTDQGRHFVIRPICYYPGTSPFWWADMPKMTIDGTPVPDWNHATTMAKFKKFIELLGAEYKDNEGLLMVEMGLYGSWGEWNTSNSGNAPQMTVENRRILVDEYQKAFKRSSGQDKFLALRYPHALSSSPTQVASTMDPMLGNLAFYDDSFSYQTIGNASNRDASLNQTWFTAQAMYNMRTTDTYKNAPRAGEPRPETTQGHPIEVNGIKVPQFYGLFLKHPNHSKDTSYEFNGTTKIGKDEDFAKSVLATRQSWLTTQRLFSSSSSEEEKNNGRKLIKLLGYQLVVTQQYVNRTETNGANVGVRIKNNGVAPFYFNWPVEFIAKTSTGETPLALSKTDGTTWNLKEVFAKEGSAVTTKEFTGTLTGLPSAACDVIMRFKNPLLNVSSKARPLRFLNLEQDTKKDGWITLASLAALPREPNTYSLETSSTNGIIVVSPPGGVYTENTMVEVTAVPNFGYAFGSWGGDRSGSANPTTITMNGNRTVTANFTELPQVGQNVLLVPGQTTLNASDEAIRARLVSLGHTVTTIDQNTVVTGDANGKGLVVISSTVSSGTINTKFRDVTVPVINWETGLQDDFGFTTQANQGTSGTHSSLTIENGNHRMAAGLAAGTQTIANTLGNFGFGNPGGNPIIIASIDGNSSQACIYAYEKDAPMEVGTAPARRVNLFLQNDTYVVLNANGLALFDAAVRWATTVSYPLTTTASHGSISLNPTGGLYESGTTVGVSVTPSLGYRFVGWSGDLTGTSTSTLITMDSAKSISANFIRVHTLASTATNGSIVLDPPEGIYDEGSTVTVTAVPAQGFRFTQWSGLPQGEGTTTTITMSGDVSISPIFELIIPSLIYQWDDPDVIIKWPLESSPAWRLEWAEDLDSPSTWTELVPPYQSDATDWFWKGLRADDKRFFRLRHP